MKYWTDRQRLWFYRGLVLLSTAVLVHLAAVWAAPRVIMQVLLRATQAIGLQAHNQAAFPAPVTAASRSIVLPSPDLLYSICMFDLRQGPVRVTANPQLPGYWSIALYASNSDNFYVLNDRQAHGKPVDLWLVSRDSSAEKQTVPAGSEVVITPSATGLLLMRVLTGDYDTQKSLVEPARHTLRCDAA
jgi:uncharacterized membrane protein